MEMHRTGMGKKNLPTNAKGDRLAYSDFGDRQFTVATERAVPDLPPAQQHPRVQASRKGRKGKTVTVVSGFQSSPATLTALVKTLKAQCGAGGTAKDNTIEIQGDHVDTVVQALVKLGYNAKKSGG